MFFEKLRQFKELKNEKYSVPEHIIKESHRKCHEKRVKQNITQLHHALTKAEIEILLSESTAFLTAVWPILKEDIYSNFLNEDQLIILCNNEGYVIALLSSPKVLELCYRMNIRLGSCFREEACGTNAIAFAMYLKRMVIIKGEQHYCYLFRDWSSIAVPIRSVGGDIIGYIDITMYIKDELGHSLALLHLAAKYIENKIIRQYTQERTTMSVYSSENRFSILSDRELEVIRLIAKGKTIIQIAGIIKISFDTVKTYQKRIYRKLNIKNKIECLNKARKLGIIDD